MDLFGSGQFTGGVVDSYWSDTSSVAFTPALAQQLMNGSAYVTLATMAHPLGLLRGQLTTSSACATVGVGIAWVPVPGALGIRPTVVADLATITLGAGMDPGARLAIMDLAGAVVRELPVGAQREVAVDLSALADGVYFLRLINAGLQQSLRFVKSGR